MSRTASVLAGVAVLATSAALVIPTTGAAAADSCTAWGTLPARVVLGPHGATVRTSLHGTAGCAGATFDNGGTAVLRAPDRRDDVPMRWGRLGDTDEATYYPSLDRPGTYRLVDGATQTYDADFVRIPSAWRATATVVKYQGRFVRLRTDRRGVTATLQAYGGTGWQGQRRVAVHLQRRTASGAWTTVASGRTGGGGHVHLAARLARSAHYRLVSTTTRDVWGTSRKLSARPGAMSRGRADNSA